MKKPKTNSLKNKQDRASFELLMIVKSGLWKPNSGIFMALNKAKAIKTISKIVPEKSEDVYAKFKIFASIPLCFKIA